MAQASSKPGTFRPRVKRYAVAPHWLKYQTTFFVSFQVVTPLLRCLGNIASGDDKYCLLALNDERLLTALSKFLQSEHRHVKKESLWALSNMSGL